MTLTAIFKAGYEYKKAGVIVGGISLQHQPQALYHSFPMIRLNQ